MKTIGTVIKKFLILTASLCLLAATTGTSRAAVAATITVSVTSDDTSSLNGTCSLREAILAANTNTSVDGCASGSSSGTDQILIPDNVNYYVLGSLGDLVITSSVRITGGSSVGVIIDADSDVDPDDRIFFINAPGQLVTLENMTLKNGEATDVGIINDIGYGNSGGAIFNNSNLTLRNLVIENNNADTSGGGLKNIGFAELYEVSFTGNHSETGAAISNDGTLIIDKGVIYNNGRFKVDGELDRLGGGIDNGRSGTVMLSNVTVSGNLADEGGGIWNGGQSMAIVNSTIVYNSGNLLNKSSDMTVQNTIVGFSEVTQDCFNSEGTLTSLGYNIDTGTSCGFTAIGDKDGSETAGFGLDALMDNGGSTLTHALQPGSVAIDAGNPTACPTTDQRGYYRSGRCDIGAFEFNGQLFQFIYLPLVLR